MHAVREGVCAWVVGWSLCEVFLDGLWVISGFKGWPMV
jgi:hypothetical protein